MNVVVETAFPGVSIGFFDENTSHVLSDPKARGESLSDFFGKGLAHVGANLLDIANLVISVGPGSFTGLRTGMAFCQGLCFQNAIQLWGISTLQALQFQVAKPESVGALIYARPGQSYLRTPTIGDCMVPNEDLPKMISGCEVLTFGKKEVETDFIKEIETLDLKRYLLVMESPKKPNSTKANYIQPFQTKRA